MRYALERCLQKIMRESPALKSRDESHNNTYNIYFSKEKVVF